MSGLEARGPNGPTNADPTPNPGTRSTVCVMLATIMQALDTTIANVALPYMQGSLSATLDQINWVLTSYIVAAAIATPVTGFLDGAVRAQAAVPDRRRRLHRRLGAVRHRGTSLEQMVLFRLLQGLFGARSCRCRRPCCSISYPKEKHGSAMAMWGVGVMVGPILGPTLGGWLTEAYNWRWVFYINVPVGILTFAGLSAYLTETKITQGQLRLVRLRHAERRHRLVPDDARPRRAARLVLLDRDRDRGGAGGARLLPVHRPDLHGRSSPSSIRASSATATSPSGSASSSWSASSCSPRSRCSRPTCRT